MSMRAHGPEAQAMAAWCQAENASALRAFLELSGVLLLTIEEERSDKARQEVDK